MINKMSYKEKKMTKKSLIIPVIGIVVMLAACASTGGATNKEYVKFENQSRHDAPKGVIVGVGQASTKGLTASLARQSAESRARADVARQMSALVKSRFVDLEAGAEGASFKGDAYQAGIVETLSKAQLNGTKVLKVDTDSSGLNYFVAISYDVAEAKKLAAEAINKSELAKNKKASDTAIADMNTAFDREFN
jgi:protein involved in sex pheromone biosynthesis